MKFYLFPVEICDFQVVWCSREIDIDLITLSVLKSCKLMALDFFSAHTLY
jgi:hypothetical protein